MRAFRNARAASVGQDELILAPRFYRSAFHPLNKNLLEAAVVGHLLVWSANAPNSYKPI